MGIFGTFLALGWLGGNLINDSVKQSKLDRSYNEQHKGERIYSYGGKYYDRETGKRVFSRFIKDPVTGGTSKVWIDVYGKYTPGSYIYNEGQEKWEKRNEEMKAEIEKAQKEKNPVYLKQAEENGLRFAKCILPFRPGNVGIRTVYFDRMENATENGERKYYEEELVFGNTYYLRELVYENRKWKRKMDFCRHPIYHDIYAKPEDKYMTKEELVAENKRKEENLKKYLDHNKGEEKENEKKR